MTQPFSRSEVKKGRLLGSGGFSSVYEIEGFQPDEVLSAGVTQVEEVSRQFLTEHPMRQCEANKKHSRPAIPRYAVKHLRHSLTRDPERFERAAIDLVLEGQLLLAMDHPHIISIRGWSYEGPDAYRSGKYSDYFLILDRLAETAEIRIEKWRSSLRKYRSRQAFPWCRKKYETKIQNLLRDRINTARCVASAIEYMHDRRVIHRDVKTANLGFDVHNEVKIFDFGLSRMLPDESEKDENGAYSMSRVGTRIYMAPEVRHKQPYNLSADVYSFGVVLWELLSLSTATDSMIRARSALERYDSGGDWLPICPCWPLVIQDTIRQCLSDDPADRPCIGEVCMVLRDVLTCLNHGGKDVEAQRRRSTLRLDLSTVKEKESLDSRTSHVSSSHFESEEL